MPDTILEAQDTMMHKSEKAFTFIDLWSNKGDRLFGKRQNEWTEFVIMETSVKKMNMVRREMDGGCHCFKMRGWGNLCEELKL